MVVADGSDLFPLGGLEHQMVNVAGVALHHLGEAFREKTFSKTEQNWLDLRFCA